MTVRVIFKFFRDFYGQNYPTVSNTALTARDTVKLVNIVVDSLNAQAWNLGSDIIRENLIFGLN